MVFEDTQQTGRLHPLGEETGNVEYTISEDFAAGITARQEQDLRRLHIDKDQIVLRADSIVDNPNVDQSRLQEYQRQLILLEQQNIRRLRMARSECDSLEKAGADRSHIEDQISSKRNKRANSEGGQDGGNAGPNHDEEPCWPYEVLYMIHCTGELYRHHTAPAFRDVPFQHGGISPRSKDDTSDTEGDDSQSSHGTSSPRFRINPFRGRSNHLNGNLPILDLNSYMEDDDGIGFVVFRDVYCAETSVIAASAGEGKSWHESVFIKSDILKTAIDTVATCYFNDAHVPAPNPKLGPNSPGIGPDITDFNRRKITPPHLFLFHHREALREYAARHTESAPHVNALLNYGEQRYGLDFEEADRLFQRGMVTQRHLLKLFVPNEIVVSGTYGQYAAFVVQKWPSMGAANSVSLKCWHWQTNGDEMVRKPRDLSVQVLDVETPIRDLLAYPLRYASPETHQTLFTRGQKYWRLCCQSHVSYRGWNVTRDQFYPDLRFMIDHKVYRKMHPNAEGLSFTQAGAKFLHDRRPSHIPYNHFVDNHSVDTDTALLLPPNTYGFYLTEKKWINLFVDGVSPVRWNKSAYEKLVLPRAMKDLVKALVTVRTSQRGVKQGLGVGGKREDIISGKGNGLIMLLHGGPGTGKSLTAVISYQSMPSVAEIAEMPLYRVTCGDIGTSADAVEKYLNGVLYLGKTWNCVLLLDEADVFLEERTMSDLKRNSLVSVFLRTLEYYDGILILTSNRVGTFDEAFKSRIQVALHYENLTRSSRKKVWENFLEMLDEDEEDVNFDEIRRHIDELARVEMNGRQIRNALTTARQLAIYKEERLEWEHIEQSIKVSMNFNQYIKGVHGHTDDQWAREEKLR